MAILAKRQTYSINKLQADTEKNVEVATGALIVSAIATMASAVMNWFSSSSTNKRNIAAAEEQNEITRAREDTALQRRVADARAAGLSPLAAIDTGAAAASQGITAQQIAPQMDLSQLVGALSTWSNATETQRHNVATEEAGTAALNEQIRQFDKTFEQQHEFKLMDNELKNKEITLKTNELTEKVRQFNEDLKERKYEHDRSELQSAIDYVYKDYEQISEQLGFQPEHEYIDVSTDEGWKNFQNKMMYWEEGLEMTLNKYYVVRTEPGHKADSFSINANKSNSTSGGINLNQGADGTSKGIGLNASNTQSNGGGSTMDIFRERSAEIRAELNRAFPIPYMGQRTRN